MKRVIEILPVAKPRMTRRDKWLNPPRPAVAQYRAFADELRYLLHGYEVPPVFDIIFYLPCPPSWSAKKRREMHGKPHQQKPDIDNIIKAWLDSLTVDDAYVYDVHAAKYWTDGDGYIVLESETP